MRKLSYILIVLGLLIVLYPTASEYYSNYKEEQLFAEWENSIEFDQEEALSLQQSYQELNELLLEEIEEIDALEEVEIEEVEEIAEVNAEETEVEPKPAQPAKPKPNPIATIQINKINLKLPVLSGATQENLQYAAAHMKETTSIGEVGNAAIAAHRARTHGRLFNRLNEVAIGDEIMVNHNGKQFKYTVFKISIVDPTDVSVLNRNNKDSILTLITCDPVKNPTHRLIIHAKM